MKLFVFLCFLFVLIDVSHATDPCDELNPPVTYPISSDAMKCIMWGELSVFDHDSGPLRDEPNNYWATAYFDWNTIAVGTAEVIACRNWKEKGLTFWKDKDSGKKKGEVNCKCPPAVFAPVTGESWRSNQHMNALVDLQLNEFAGKTDAEMEKLCDGHFHFYHYVGGNGRWTKNGYMNGELAKKTKNRHKAPESYRFSEWHTYGGTTVHIYFPHDDDVDNRFN